MSSFVVLAGESSLSMWALVRRPGGHEWVVDSLTGAIGSPASGPMEYRCSLVASSSSLNQTWRSGRVAISRSGGGRQRCEGGGGKRIRYRLVVVVERSQDGVW